MTRAINSHSRMSRLKVSLGLKRDTPTKGASYVAISKFEKDLDANLKLYPLPESDHRSKVINNFFKIANSKGRKFFALEEYVHKFGWKETILLLSKNRESGNVLKELLKKKEQENGLKEHEINTVSQKDLEEAFHQEESDEGEIGEEP